ncbi:MAG: bifunctional diguanylate cyclase/phosphodiesterase [Butyrivibrio sp.]|nr:bifunctional diguanylate cyclase/phosphodiesterase [Butyrivibrio sp.]
MSRDPLTGLYDFKDFIELTTKYVAENEGSYAIVTNDVSNFKYINKFYSVETGNLFISEMAKFFFTDNPHTVYACRIDSEQFTMLARIDGISREDEVARIENYNIKFEEIMNSRYPDIYIHVYTGVYFLENSNENMRQAFDKSKMSKSKMKGRYDISCQVYDPKDYIIKESVMGASNLFRKAVSDDRILVYLQPKISSKKSSLTGAEALVRIIDEGGRIVPPAEFIPALEQIGIIGMLDRIMVEKVFALQKKWKSEGRELFVISVNISRQEYIKSDFSDRMIELSRKYKVPPEYIEFEILENMFITNSNAIITSTNELREFGFRVSIDDFGSGYSSLNQVANLPADTVKMDITFARVCLKTKKGRTVVKSLIHMLNDIDFDVVFEGIETEEQKDLVNSYGCDVIQGYYYSMPIPVEEFEKKFLGKM